MTEIKYRIPKYWTIVRWILLSISIVLFIISMYQISQDKTHSDPGILFGICTITFILGMLIFLAEYGGWISSLGLLLFFVIMYLGMVFTSLENTKIQFVGSLIFPLSIFFLGGWLYWFNLGKTQWKNKRLLKKGILAKGTILSYTRTGVSLTKNTDFPKYGVALEIEVKPNGLPIFIAYANDMLSEHEITNLEKGLEISVRYMENDSENVSIQWN